MTTVFQLVDYILQNNEYIKLYSIYTDRVLQILRWCIKNTDIIAIIKASLTIDIYFPVHTI